MLPNAALWHKEKHKHGLAEIKQVVSFEKYHGLVASSYGRAYGGLSEVSHPTKSAAENSIVTVNIVHGGDQDRARIAHDTITEQDLPGMLYLLIWTIVAEADGMISLGIKLDVIPMSAKFFDQYQSATPAPTT